MKKIILASETPKQTFDTNVSTFLSSGNLNKILGGSNLIAVGNAYTPKKVVLQHSWSFLEDDFNQWNEAQRKKARKALRQWQSIDHTDTNAIQLFENEYYKENTNERTSFGQSLEYTLQRLNKIEYLNIVCVENSLSVSALAGFGGAISTTQEFTQILGTDSKTLTEAQLEYIYVPNNRFGSEFVETELAQICGHNNNAKNKAITFICVAVGVVKVGNFEQKVRLFVLSDDLENFLKAGKETNKKETNKK